MFKTPSNIDHVHVRRWEYGNLARGVADSGFSWSFALSDLPNSNEFTNLYDSWRLDAVEIVLELATLTSAIGAIASPAMPTLIIYPDYDDATAPTGISVAEQVSQAERFTFSAAKPSFSRRVVPRAAIALATTSGGVLAGALNMKQPFIDCAYPSSVHFGVKAWIANYNTSTVGESGAILNVSFRYHLTMRNPR